MPGPVFTREWPLPPLAGVAGYALQEGPVGEISWGPTGVGTGPWINVGPIVELSVGTNSVVVQSGKLSVPGAGAGSEQFGLNAVAGAHGVAAGHNAVAGASGIAVGEDASSLNSQGVAVGQLAVSNGYSSVALGWGAVAFANAAVALGARSRNYTTDRITHANTSKHHSLVAGHIFFELTDFYGGGGLQCPATSGRYAQVAPDWTLHGTGGQTWTQILELENFFFDGTAPTAMSTFVVGGTLASGDTYLVAIGLANKERNGETFLTSPYAVTINPGDNAIVIQNLTPNFSGDPQNEEVLAYMEDTPGSGNLYLNGSSLAAADITMLTPAPVSLATGYLAFPGGGEVVDGTGRVTTPDSSASITVNSTASPGDGWSVGLAGGDSDDAALPGGRVEFYTNRIGAAHTLTLAGYFNPDDGSFSVPGAGVGSERFGLNAVAAGVDNVVVGRNAVASFGANAIIVGANSDSDDINSVIVGAGVSLTSAPGAVAVGYLANVLSGGTGAIAIGQGSNASSSSGPSIALGYLAEAGFANAMAIGGSSEARANSISIGESAKVTHTQSVAVGQGALISKTNSVAIGYLSNVAGISGTVVGASSVVYNQRGVAVGPNNISGSSGAATGGFNIVVGNDNQAGVGSTGNPTDNICIGDACLAGVGSHAANGENIAIGETTVAGASSASVTFQYQSNIAIGLQTWAGGDLGRHHDCIAIGEVCRAGSDLAIISHDNIALGDGASAMGLNDCIVIGNTSSTPDGGNNNIAFGRTSQAGSVATANNNIAVGNTVLTRGLTNNIGIGHTVTAGAGGVGTDIIAIGNGSDAFGYDNITLGDFNTAGQAANDHDIIAIGDSVTAAGAGGNNHDLIALGNLITIGGTAADHDMIVMGNSATAANGHDLIVIGQAASITGFIEGIAVGHSATVTASEGIAIGHGASAGANEVAIGIDTSVSVKFKVGTTNGTQFGSGATVKLGWYGAAPIVQPTAVGSRGGNAALASLLTQLALLGLIVDGTSA